jgi:hypothetical protein
MQNYWHQYFWISSRNLVLRRVTSVESIFDIGLEFLVISLYGPSLSSLQSPCYEQLLVLILPEYPPIHQMS